MRQRAKHERELSMKQKCKPSMRERARHVIQCDETASYPKHERELSMRDSSAQERAQGGNQA